MAVTTVLGQNVPLTISTDSGSTYRTVVCNKAWGFTGDTSITEDESDCGPHTAVGQAKWSFSVEGLYNTTPTSTEISGEELLSLWANKTSFLIKCQYPTSGTPGGDMYIQGSVYLTNYQINKTTNGFISFSGTLTGDGSVDVTA
jgi:hypothetical protein